MAEEAERRRQDTARQIAEIEAKQNSLSRERELVQNVTNASREFANRAIAAGVPQQRIEIWVGSEKRLFGKRPITWTIRGWIIQHPVPPQYVESVRDSYYSDGRMTEPEPGAYVLADGRFMWGYPPKLLPEPAELSRLSLSRLFGPFGTNGLNHQPEKMARRLYELTHTG